MIGIHHDISVRGRERGIIALFLLAAALFLFWDKVTPPIILWDESRNVVNALEMRWSGLSLVTTYAFAPDLWNTKPPLLIWLMTGSMALFGTDEWAMRLPSALAAMATLLLLIVFTRRITGSLSTALLAALFLTLSPGFFGEHGARTADYDALLLLFTTTYSQLLFLAIHRRRPPMTMLAGIGGLIALALLTKSTAALFLGTGIALHMMLTGRWRRLFEGPGYWVMAGIAVAPPLLFFLAREAAEPGYIDAAFFNDLYGRFADKVMKEERGPWLYVASLVQGWFVGGPFLFLTPLVAGRVPGKSRLLLRYALTLSITLIVIISFSHTRVLHYPLPAYPWLAIAAALVVKASVGRALEKDASRILKAGIVAFLVFCAGGAVVDAWRSRYVDFPARQFYPQAAYGQLFADLSKSGHREIIVVDPGFRADDWPHYAPQLLAYRLIWAERGLTITRQTALGAVPRGVVTASCDPATAGMLRQSAADMVRIPGCAAIRR